MAWLVPASEEDRSDAAAFAGRVARWNPMAPVRLVARTEPGVDRVTLWANTPFDVLATRSVLARLRPEATTVRAADLLSGLAVSTATEIDPGQDLGEAWRNRLPPPDGWQPLDAIPVSLINDLVRSGADRAARPTVGDGHAPGRTRTAAVPDELLDLPAITVAGGEREVTVPLRVLFALSGMGFAVDRPAEVVRAHATRSWLRLDARYGAVVRRRIGHLPLLV